MVAGAVQLTSVLVQSEDREDISVLMLFGVDGTAREVGVKNH